MIFPTNFEEKLGFTKIRQLLRDNTLCSLGVLRVDAMSFSTDRKTLQHELDLLREMMQVLQNTLKPMPTDGFYDLLEPLNRVRVVGTFLEVEEFFHLRRSLASIQALVKYFEVKPDEVNSYEGNFDDYCRVVTEKKQELEALQEQRRRAQQEEQYAQTKQKQYRSKQQRAQDAKRREQIRTLENEIEQLEQLISNLETEIADPETAADYNQINEKCSQLDEARNSLEDKMEQWAELSDMI